MNRNVIAGEVVRYDIRQYGELSGRLRKLSKTDCVIVYGKDRVSVLHKTR